jgi:phage head maturation protease
MTTQTIYGELADNDGIAARTVMVQGAHGPELRKSCFATAAEDFRSQQPARIDVDRDHDGSPVGEVIYLERRRSGSIWCVAHARDVAQAVEVQVGRETVNVEHDLFWSAESDMRDDFTDIELRSVALTAFPARVAARPIRVLAGALDHSGCTARWQLDKSDRELLERAARAHLDRRRGDPIIVHNPEAAELSTTAPPSRVEMRSATPVAVEVDRRIIELVVMPYERPTKVMHNGRVITEIVSRTAFDTIETQGNRIRVNRDHILTRTIGRAISFQPHRPEGLVAEVKIARTELGDETLALAADDCLDCSAGFATLPGGEVWETRDRRRVTRGWLDHIALTPDAAYVDARVLSVGGMAPGT